MNNEEKQLVAVYWTLMEGEWNHRLLSSHWAKKVWEGVVKCEKIIWNRWFPIATFYSDEDEPSQYLPLFVEIYEVDKACEDDLDMLEWVPSLYTKKYITPQSAVIIDEKYSNKQVLIYNYARQLDALPMDAMASADNGMWKVEFEWEEVSKWLWRRYNII